MNIKVGDSVRSIGRFSGIEGVVTRVRRGHDVDDHGTVEIRITRITDVVRYDWLEPGDLEHFTHFGWHDCLEVTSR